MKLNSFLYRIILHLNFYLGWNDFYRKIFLLRVVLKYLPTKVFLEQMIEMFFAHRNIYLIFLDHDAMTLSGHSYIWFDLQKPIERHLSLSMKFKTRSGAGNLMYVAGRLDYSILEVR